MASVLPSPSHSLFRLNRRFPKPQDHSRCIHLCAAQKAKPVDFAHGIVPIIKSRCAECHTNGKYKGSLSMDTRADILKSKAVVSGKSGMSELIKRVTSDKADHQMPPKGDRLTPKQVAVLKAWIDQDLPEALDDAAFLRRVYLDLVGQLPTPAEQVAFLKDSPKDRRAAVIKRLLAELRPYAEHWLTFWNDALRNDYAGTGYIDGGRKQISAWLYQSLLDNKPYDQFARSRSR